MKTVLVLLIEGVRLTSIQMQYAMERLWSCGSVEEGLQSCGSAVEELWSCGLAAERLLGCGSNVEGLRSLFAVYIMCLSLFVV